MASIKKHKTGLGLSLLLLLALSAFAEVFIFNYHYFLLTAAHAKQVTIPSGKFSLISAGSDNNSVFIINGDNNVFKITDIGIPVYNVKLNISGATTSFTVNIQYEDQNFSADYQNAGDFTIDPDLESSETINIQTSGKCKTLSFSFNDLNGESIAVNSVTVNSPYFSFEVPRFLLLFVLLSFLFLIIRYKPWNIAYNPNSAAQWFCYVLIALTAVFIMSWIYVVSSNDFIFSTDVSGTNDNYLLLTKAFFNGRLNLTIQPSGNLISLSNPYDYSLRMAHNVSYSWDTVLYNGKYYSYFGIAPVILLLLPFKLLTGLYMPTSLACFIFALISILAILNFYRTAVNLWFRNINFMVFACGEAAVILASNLFWLISRPNFYELACLSATAFLFLALDMLAHAQQSGQKSGAELVFAGLFFGLMTASRPNFIFYILIAVPFIIPVLRQADTIRAKLLRIAQFSAPLTVIGMIMMAYNYLRFGSVFEFGAKYQLTVSDVQFNKFNPSLLAPGLYHYLLQPLSTDLKFPFFHVIIAEPANMTHFYYNYPVAGLCNFPLLLILPACVYIIKRIAPEKKLEKRFLATALSVCAVILLVDIMYGGVILRYTLDIQPVLTAAALFLWMEVYLYFDKRKAGVPVTKLYAAVAALTIAVSLCISLTGEENRFETNDPALFHYCAQLFEFWR